MRSLARRSAAMAAAALAAPRLAAACAVCYGAADAPMTAGMNNGILTLLGFIGFVQVGLVAMFVGFWRRARRLKERRESFHLLQGGAR